MTLTTTSAAETPLEVLDAFQFESEKQKRLYDELTAEGYSIADDPAGMAEDIGTVREIECLCEMWTPRLLCKLFVKGTESLEHSFHLVPLHQLVNGVTSSHNPEKLFLQSLSSVFVGSRTTSLSQHLDCL